MNSKEIKQELKGKVIEDIDIIDVNYLPMFGILEKPVSTIKSITVEGIKYVVNAGNDEAVLEQSKFFK